MSVFNYNITLNSTPSALLAKLAGMPSVLGLEHIIVHTDKIV